MSGSRDYPRILYLMHVDWRWIKQRPHFIAEGLAKRHNVLVVYSLNPKRWELTRNDCHIKKIPMLVPLVSQFPLPVWNLNLLAQRAWLGAIIKLFNPDILWITFPLLYGLVSQKHQSLPVFYDCMDRAGYFEKNPQSRSVLRYWESQLMSAAAGVFCSSRKLYQTVCEEYGVDHKALLVRNGIAEKVLDAVPMVREEAHFHKSTLAADSNDRHLLNLAYIGTISEWLDVESLCFCLDHLSTLRIHLLGPKDVPIPAYGNRLVYHGVIDHDQLLTFCHRFDAFILPFKISPLTEAVDPVKLYEYLCFGRPVIAVEYEEIGRFLPLVHFYKTREDLLHILRSLSGNLDRLMPPGCQSESRVFLMENTWEKRVELIEKEIIAIWQGRNT